MSQITLGPSTRLTSKVAHVTAGLRRTWTDARIVDRRLMEMRTNLSRHAG